MSAKEKILSAVLGVLIFAGVVGAGGYFGIYRPVQSRDDRVVQLEDETVEKQGKLVKLQKDMARLADAKARSLPADPDVARHEYTAALSQLLQDANVPRGYTLRPKAADGRPVPEIAPKKPAYQRLAFEITMKKVDLGTLIDFLERYYELGLLQQITRFHVKRSEVENSTSAARRATAADRADLDVTLVTEAIILDGADARRTLRPVPLAKGAVLGAAGFVHLTRTPELARGLAVPDGPQVLAESDREYLAVLSKDPFHGPLPVVRTDLAARPAPKDDVSSFIKLTGITRSSDGSATADIKDAANNFDYEVAIAYKGGGPTAKVRKHYYIKDKRKLLDTGTDLDISDDTSSTARRFRVVGVVDGDGLVLVADGPPAGETTRPREDTRPGGRGGNRGRPAGPTAHPVAAVAGGIAAGVPQDKVYVWRVGQPLKTVRELPEEEGYRAVERARSGWDTVPAATPLATNPES